MNSRYAGDYLGINQLTRSVYLIGYLECSFNVYTYIIFAMLIVCSTTAISSTDVFATQSFGQTSQYNSLFNIANRKSVHKSGTLRNKAKQVRPLFGRVLTVPYPLSPELELCGAAVQRPSPYDANSNLLRTYLDDNIIWF